MRSAFINELTRLASADRNVWLVTADLGFCVFENFRDKFPEQYLNVGVAEQNLMSVAAGLAMSGKKVFAYSISTFASMRPYEQIRNDICYQNLPVFIVGGGSAFSYSTFGCTHSALEDVGLMRILPNMAVAVPGDPVEVRALINEAYRRGGPAYIRIAKRGEPKIHNDDDSIILGKAAKITDGRDVSILVSGGQLSNVVKAAAILRSEGHEPEILSFHTVKPLDGAAIIETAQKSKVIITVEEHFLAGGFGSAVAEFLADNHINRYVVRMGIRDEFPAGVGSQEYFLSRYKLSPDGIADTVRQALLLKPPQ